MAENPDDPRVVLGELRAELNHATDLHNSGSRVGGRLALKVARDALTALAQCVEERDAWMRGEDGQRRERMKSEDVLIEKLRQAVAENARLAAENEQAMAVVREQGEALSVQAAENARLAAENRELQEQRDEAEELRRRWSANHGRAVEAYEKLRAETAALRQDKIDLVEMLSEVRDVLTDMKWHTDRGVLMRINQTLAPFTRASDGGKAS